VDAAAEVADTEGEAARVAQVAQVDTAAAPADAAGAGDRAAAALAGRSREITQRSWRPVLARVPRL
jgi:hypothetical protein